MTVWHIHRAGIGTWNTKNTGKYQSSGSRNTKNVQYQNFNTIKYQKKSILNFNITKKFGISRKYLTVLHFSKKIPKNISKKKKNLSDFRYFKITENISNTVQYYWILKMFNTHFSILPNTEKKFDTEVQ